MLSPFPPLQTSKYFRPNLNRIWGPTLRSQSGVCCCVGIAGRDSFCTSVATGLGRGSLPDFPSPEEGVGGKREGGGRDQFFSQRNSQWLQEGLPGRMPFQLIPNGPPPPCQPLLRNVPQAPLAGKPPLPPSPDCKFLVCRHHVLFMSPSPTPHPEPGPSGGYQQGFPKRAMLQDPCPSCTLQLRSWPRKGSIVLMPPAHLQAAITNLSAPAFIGTCFHLLFESLDTEQASA